ncbi:MAG TPA: SagB/ThcOx family dehydrogenase, partial [Thermoleophilia bacterium]|nr:SagB/ThcOx family dehydrogenase [Thermoleophilia bacterium]
RLDWANQPETFKRYPDAPRVPLPPAPQADGPGFWEVVSGRRSVREYAKPHMTLEDLSALAWAAAGISHEEYGFPFRTAPSAGGLYPVETYIVANHVEGLESGIYHYAVRERALELLQAGDLRRAVAAAALDQPMAYDADAVFFWSAVFGRSTWKYRQRGYRYVYLDAGHIAQNVALAAVALGLGTCQIGALFDDEANELIGLNGEGESVIYMTSVGRPA